jgi:hypothetical protein
MFNQTWKKYLPVISILIKRSANGEQSLTMNHTDFERASGGRKMKWSFPVLQLNNGRILNNGTKYPAIVTEMISELQMDEQISKLLHKKEFEFSMSNDFKLLIKNISAGGAENVIPADDSETALAEQN